MVLLEQSVERNPGFDSSHLDLAAAYVQLGRLDDAAWSVEEALAISPNLTLEQLHKDSLYLLEADLEHYYGALRKAGVPE